MELRLCKVKGETGYFHTWEYYSMPVGESPLVGGAPAGVYSEVFGIVEFADGCRRENPVNIKFCDAVNAELLKFPRPAKKRRK